MIKRNKKGIAPKNKQSRLAKQCELRESLWAVISGGFVLASGLTLYEAGAVQAAQTGSIVTIEVADRLSRKQSADVLAGKEIRKEKVPGF